MRGPLKPGTTAPRSDQYELMGPRGGRTGEERIVVRREPLPPSHQERRWPQVTEHRRGNAALLARQ
jgi:hypothetical protein